jgi:hypothetical protein
LQQLQLQHFSKHLAASSAFGFSILAKALRQWQLQLEHLSNVRLSSNPAQLFSSNSCDMRLGGSSALQQHAPQQQPGYMQSTPRRQLSSSAAACQHISNAFCNSSGWSAQQQRYYAAALACQQQRFPQQQRLVSISAFLAFSFINVGLSASVCLSLSCTG